MSFDGASDSGAAIRLDSSAEGGGQGAGARPVELILVSLPAGCTAMDVLSILHRMRQPVDKLRVQAIGRRAKDYPRAFTEIVLTYQVDGEGLDPSAIERAIRLSQERYCSVSAMLSKTATIRTRFEIAPATTA